MGTGFAIKMFDFSPSPSEPTRAMEMLERRFGLGDESKGGLERE